MPRKQTPPAYRARRKGARVYACVTLRDAATGTRKDFQLGEHGSPESHAAYARVLAEWEAAGRRIPDQPIQTPAGPTVNQIVAGYLQAIAGRYVPSEMASIRAALRVLVQLYGPTPAESFGPFELRTVRDAMIRGDATLPRPRLPWNRATVNSQIHRLRAVWKWAASYELLPIARYRLLCTLGPLQPGRSAAAEPIKVRPVAMTDVQATLPYLPAVVRDMVLLQALTGMRPGEVCALRVGDLDVSDPAVWVARPLCHKTAHLGKDRAIYFGPQAIEIVLANMTGKPLDAYLFSPAESERRRRSEAHARRATPLSCGNRPGTNRVANPRFAPGERYDTTGYRRAVVRAVERANADARLTGRPCIAPWFPLQLRHTFATEVRRRFGLEQAQILLGHSSAAVTDAVYAERDAQRAREIALLIG